MFLLSKLIWTAVNPISLIFLLGGAGLSIAALGRRKLGAFMAIGAASIYLVLGLSPASDWLRHSLESREKAASLDEIAGISGIIVLGGGVSGLSPDGTPHLSAFGGRMTESVKLAERFPALPIVFSGGIGDIVPRRDVVPEAQAALVFYRRAGIDETRVRLEDRSRNTFENALLTAGLLQPTPQQRWILVTSAFHMPRAKALFEAQGFKVLPWPTDYDAKFSHGCWEPIPLGREKLCAASMALKEWVGIAAYWLRGDIAHI
jgi:uncharacterized SAM-binding protein YcdF (DUF218 family)